MGTSEVYPRVVGCAKIVALFRDPEGQGLEHAHEEIRGRVALVRGMAPFAPVVGDDGPRLAVILVVLQPLNHVYRGHDGGVHLAVADGFQVRMRDFVAENDHGVGQSQDRGPVLHIEVHGTGRRGSVFQAFQVKKHGHYCGHYCGSTVEGRNWFTGGTCSCGSGPNTTGAASSQNASSSTVFFCDCADG